MPDLLSPEEFASLGSNGADVSGFLPGEQWLHHLVDSSANDRYWQMYNDQVNRIYNATEAEKARAWQEMMSNTQIQRLMKDAESAGINPYYVLSGGNGASPGGASASSSSSSYTGSKSNSPLSKIMTLLLIFGKLLAA